MYLQSMNNTTIDVLVLMDCKAVRDYAGQGPFYFVLISIGRYGWLITGQNEKQCIINQLTISSINKHSSTKQLLNIWNLIIFHILSIYYHFGSKRRKHAKYYMLNGNLELYFKFIMYKCSVTIYSNRLKDKINF